MNSASRRAATPSPAGQRAGSIGDENPSSAGGIAVRHGPQRARRRAGRGGRGGEHREPLSLERSEDRIGGIGLRADAAGREQHAVVVQVEGQPEGRAHGEVTAGLVDLVLAVGVHLGAAVAAGDVAHAGGDVRGSVGGLDEQRDVQRLQGLREAREVAEPEVDLGRGVVVGAPLARGEDEERDEAVVGARGRGEEGGVVIGAQVAAKPDEGAGHRGLG